VYRVPFFSVYPAPCLLHVLSIWISISLPTSSQRILEKLEALMLMEKLVLLMLT